MGFAPHSAYRRREEGTELNSRRQSPQQRDQDRLNHQPVRAIPEQEMHQLPLRWLLAVKCELLNCAQKLLGNGAPLQVSR